MPAGRSIPGASRLRRSRPAVLPTDALVATCDDARRVLAHAALAVRSSRIAAVGPTAALEASPVHAGQPCRSLMLLPGLSNAHTHAVLLALHGTVEDWEGEATDRRMSPISYAMSDAGRGVVAALGCLEAIRGGSTAREKRLG